MATIRIDTSDLTRLQRKLGGDFLSDALKRIVKKVAITAENEGKKRSPVDTGRLRASITHATQNLTGWAGTNVRYGLYLDQPRTRRPNYRNGPFSGGSTAGWLTDKAFKSAAMQAEDIVADEVRTIESAWRR
jgi:hypothetical protein